MKRLLLAGLAVTVLGCAEAQVNQFGEQVQELALEVTPDIERAVGLDFKYPPKVAVRTKDEVFDYLERKIATEFPPEEMERITTAYRLFRLLPPELDLEQLLIELLSEQVVGFYDPQTDTLYVVAGAEQLELRLIVAHELVHALQAQYAPLDSILTSRGDNDRRSAAQAVFEGQGMIASLRAMMPDGDLTGVPEFWGQMRETIRQQQSSMPVLSSAPLILRETLIFPYLGGADFVRWYGINYPGTVPFGERLPTSTEQILRPERYRDGDQPVSLRFNGPDILYEDGLGEFETRVLMTELLGSESEAIPVANDWDGDRYAIYDTGDGYGLVWWSVWDSAEAAQRFYTAFERAWVQDATDGRTSRVELTNVNGVPAVLVVDGPEGWSLLQQPPTVAVATSDE